MNLFFFKSNILLFFCCFVQIRKQIKLSQFTIEHLKEIIDNYSIVLHEYSRVLFEMLNSFFKEKDPIVSQFARSAYRFDLNIIRIFVS